VAGYLRRFPNGNGGNGGTYSGPALQLRAGAARLEIVEVIVFPTWSYGLERRFEHRIYDASTQFFGVARQDAIQSIGNRHDPATLIQASNTGGSAPNGIGTGGYTIADISHATNDPSLPPIVIKLTPEDRWGIEPNGAWVLWQPDFIGFGVDCAVKLIEWM
jgi:hypothetical protein